MRRSIMCSKPKGGVLICPMVDCLEAGRCKRKRLPRKAKKEVRMFMRSHYGYKERNLNKRDWVHAWDGYRFVYYPGLSRGAVGMQGASRKANEMVRWKRINWGI